MLKKSYDLNREGALLLDAHGVGWECNKRAGTIRLHLRHPVELALTAFPVKKGRVIVSRLDVAVTLPDGRQLCEALGDVGQDLDEALRENVNSFARSSFHVMIEAFDDRAGEFEPETWTCADGPIRVTIGNGIIKGTGLSASTSKLPEGLMDLIEQAVGNEHLVEGFHFLRVYYCQSGGRALSCEFIIDDRPRPRVEESLAELDWVRSEDFYSVRIFAVLRR